MTYQAMNHNAKRWIRSLLAALGCVLIFLGFLAVLPEKEKVHDKTPDSVFESTHSTRYSEELGRGLRIRSGDPYSPILTAGSAHIEKRRFGPLVLPAFNILVFEKVDLIFSIHDREAFTLPAEIEALITADPDNPIEPSARSTRAVDSVNRNETSRPASNPIALSAVHKDFLRSLTSDRNISGLQIRSLRLSVSDGGQKNTFLQAARADGHPDGTLRLRNCRFIDEHREERVTEKAVLHPTDPVTLIVGDQHILIHEVIDAFR